MAKPTKTQKSIQTKCKRMLEIRLKRRQKIRENRKPSEIKPDTFDSVCDKFVDVLLRKRVAHNACSHYLIGASNVYPLIIGAYSLKQAHAMFFTKAENKVIGQAGEEAFIRNNQNIVAKHPFGICRNIPWFCATGDYLVDEFGVKVVVEVKTFVDFERANYFYNNIDQRALIQIWIQLEIFCVDRGKLVIYYLDRVAKIVFLVGVVNICKESSIFTNEFILVSVIRYVDFLKDYFERINVFPSNSHFERLSIRLINNVLSSTPILNMTLENPFIRNVKRHLNETCPYLEDISMSSVFGQRTEFIPYKEMFKCHKFVNKSRKTRLLVFDDEYRRVFLDKMFNKIDQTTKQKIKEVSRYADSGFVIKDVIGCSKLKRTQSLTECKKRKERLSLSQITKKYQLVIDKLRAKIKLLKQENKHLKSKKSQAEQPPEAHNAFAKWQENTDASKRESSIITKSQSTRLFDIRNQTSKKLIKKNLKFRVSE